VRFPVSLIFPLWLSVISCAGTSLFGPIESNLADPIAIVIDEANNRAYVLNSNLSLSFTEGSLLVLDLSDPIQPTILSQEGNPVSLQSLSSQIFFDAGQVFVTNRFSENRKDVVDTVFRINVEEGEDFGTQTLFDSGEDPFGIACCDANGRFYVVAEGVIESYALSDSSDRVSRSLEVVLETNELLAGRSTTHLVILGSQIFLTNRSGRIYVLNADEITDTTANPIDYVITGMGDLRGIATDGTLLYVIESAEASVLRVIDPSGLPPISPDAERHTEIAIDAESLTVQLATLTLGNDANELVMLNNKAYVTQQEDDTVAVVDVTDSASPTLEETITVGDAPFGLTTATLGGNDYLYVTNLDSNTLSIIDLATNSVVGTFP